MVMNVVAAYHIFVCALFLVQGGMWTACRTWMDLHFHPGPARKLSTNQ